MDATFARFVSAWPTIVSPVRMTSELLAYIPAPYEARPLRYVDVMDGARFCSRDMIRALRRFVAEELT